MTDMKKLTLLQLVIVAGLGLVGWSLAGLNVWQILLWIALPVLVLGHAWFWWFRHVYFYRDPPRQAACEPSALLSPADGQIMYLYPVRAGEVESNKLGQRIRVSELAKTEFAESEGWLMGIYMSPFDVHFIRAPVAGAIQVLHHHQTGLNLPMVDLWEYIRFAFLHKAVNLFARRYHLENERLTMRIQGKGPPVFLVLIADKFVNKITRFFAEGGAVERGGKLAFIERGSQTDVFIPTPSMDFRVKPGDQVYAGKTVLGYWVDNSHESSA